MAKAPKIAPVAPVEVVIPKVVFFCEKCGNILYKDTTCCKMECIEMTYAAAKKKQDLKKYDIVFVTPATRKVVEIEQSVKVDKDGNTVSKAVGAKVRAARKKKETVETIADAPSKKPRATRKKAEEKVVGMVIPVVEVEKKPRATRKKKV